MAGLFFSQTTAHQKRKNFRESLNAPQITTLPGAFNPLTAKLIEDIGGFSGVYVSGAVLANDLGLPDIGLTTLTEVAQRSGQIARATEVPVAGLVTAVETEPALVMALVVAQAPAAATRRRDRINNRASKAAKVAREDNQAVSRAAREDNKVADRPHLRHRRLVRLSKMPSTNWRTCCNDKPGWPGRA